LSQQQRETVERLSAPFDVWLAEPPVDLADLGRAREGASQRYAALRRLEARAGDLRAELDPYAPARSRADPRFDEQRRSRRDPGTILVDLLPGTIESTCQPVVAARLGFSGRPVFNPAPLFDAHTRDVYMNPLAFRSFTADMQLPHVRVHASRSEVLKLLQVLDSSGRLALVPAHWVPVRLRNGAHAVYKDEERSRLIVDARPPNARHGHPH